MSDTILSIERLSHWFGSNRVLFNINLEIRRGQIVALVGPSGCGKSTLLRAIVGTHLPRQGRTTIRDNGHARPVEAPGRDRGIVYQRYSLFPHLTAQENVAYGLMVDQTTIPRRLFRRRAWKALRKDHMRRAADMLERMRLGAALKKYPPELSGGMCQRVAIAQALIMNPSVLLLDEPFGALDEATREELQRILLTLYAENMAARERGDAPPHTVMIVTHEINEAIFVSDRVIGLSQYWNWREVGESSHPGATIVYDKPAPVFAPDDERDFLSFRDQKNEILHAVFDPDYCQSYNDYIALAGRAAGKEN
ncbi:MAG: ATP-binding cassette domain-containing protein [Kiritimatiellae bacterium]|nr:ATP-binding cassette domain-containing protein [Kiritimatiellia bacterium]